MGTNKIISGMFSQMAEALTSLDDATKGHPHSNISNQRGGGDTAKGYPHNHISNKEVGVTTKGYRSAASPDVYQSGGRHPNNHISNKKVRVTTKGYHHNHSFSKKVGDNHFKILAYRKAAKVLSDYPVDVAEAYRTGGIKALTAIPGIGAALSKKIAEFIETGHMKKYDEVMSQRD